MSNVIDFTSIKQANTVEALEREINDGINTVIDAVVAKRPELGITSCDWTFDIEWNPSIKLVGGALKTNEDGTFNIDAGTIYE